MSADISANAKQSDVRGVLIFGAGLTVGLAIGLTIALLARPQSPPVGGAPTQSATVVERWFIWEGSSPLVGQSFPSEAACEKGRRQWLLATAQTAQDEAKAAGNITYGQIEALGYNPEVRIEEQLAQAERAYCHRSGD